MLTLYLRIVTFLEDFYVLTIKVMGLQPVATKAAITHMRKRCQQEPEASWLQDEWFKRRSDETRIVCCFFLLDLADSAPENFILQLFYNYFDSRIVTYAHFPVDMVSVIS